MESGARRTPLTGRIIQGERRGSWQLAGERPGELPVSVPVEFSDVLEVLGHDGRWSRGRVEYSREHGYIVRLCSGVTFESMESIAARAADVRRVRA